MRPHTVQTESVPGRPAQVTVIAATRPARLAKRFSLVDGKLRKEGAGSLSVGRIEIVDARTPGDLAEILQGLASPQALIYGIPKHAGASQVVSKSVLDRVDAVPEGTIARTAENFVWPSGPGWLMLDYDPPPDADAMSGEALRAVLYDTAPALRNAPHLWAVSASSEIWNAETGERLRGISGQRLYVLVADARDIPRAGQALFDRLWLTGHGYYQVSKSGALLKRSPIDASVWQTNRLDFAAPPACKPPLEARRPDPIVYNDGASPLSTVNAIPALSSAEKQTLGELQGTTASTPAVQTQREQAQERWVDERIEAVSAARGGDLPESEREALRNMLSTAVTKRRLYGDFELIHSSGQTVTVGQVLDSPDRWHNQRFADPLEHDYGGGDRRIAWLNLRSGGTPFIYSHAHGGQRFRLLRPTTRLELDAGEAPQYLTTICERLGIEADVYERAGRLVRVVGAELITVEAPWLQTKIESCFELFKYDGRSQQLKRVDCPESVAKRVIAARGVWGLPAITGVVQFPVLRADGSLLIEPGFDEATGLLHLSERANHTVPRELNQDDLRAALARIWAPFRLFPFADDLSRGVFLSMLLSCVCRPTIPTAPGYLIRAHTAGTGKTRLAECGQILAGAPVRAMPMPEDGNEVEKRLLAKLVTGTPAVLIDNIQGNIDFASLCAFMTSSEPEGRILGKTAVVSAANRSMWFLTGNNVSATGDTYRRILPITLDAGSESPEARRFPFDPRDVIRERLDDYRADLLSVLLSFVNAGMPQGGAGGLGSFETWERLVRQCVVWLVDQKLTPAPMADPIGVIRLSRSEDPARMRHGTLLSAWYDVYGSQPVEAKTVAALVTNGPLMSGDSETNAKHLALCEAAREAAEIRGAFNTRSFGWYLRRHRGVVVEGLRIDQEQGSTVCAWRVCRVEEPSDV